MSALQIMTERRAAKKVELDALLALPTEEKRDMTDDEQTKFDGLITEIRAQDERIKELADEAKRSASAAEARKEFVVPGDGTPQGGAKVTDPTVYVRENHKVSYFRDLVTSKFDGDNSAVDRLVRHSKAAADVEQRALGNTNATGGSGGEFAPPEWIVDEWIRLARPGRVIADLFHHSDVPRGVSSINIPKISTGTSVALQTSQNSALAQTDLTTTYVSSGFSTLGGKQLVSQMLLDQSAINFDQVITTDLAAAYGQVLGTNIWSGAGTGVNNNAQVNGLTTAAVPAGNVVGFATTTPTAANLYSKAGGALAAFSANRFAQPTHWLMHPRRWYWLVTQSDTQSRPLVVPTQVAYNPIATADNPSMVAGNVGMFLGLPVVIDPLMPANFGAGSNQDRVYLIKADDLWLFESDPRSEVFRETYADSVGVLFRLYAYVATIVNRQANSIAYIDGTGLIAPTF